MSKLYGEHAMELVKESVRAQDSLSPFNEDKVRKCLDEMKTLYQINADELEETGLISPAVSVRHEALERNKRCILAYVNHRANKIANYRSN